MPDLMIDTTAESIPYRANPGGQAEFAADWTHSTIALAGGWMSGKTFIGARKLLTLHIHNAFTPDGRATFVPSACCAPTYPLLMKYDMPELERACREANLRCVYKAKERCLLLPDLGTKSMPSTIGFYSAERPDRIAGWQAGAGWGDEATRWPENWLEPSRDAFLQFQSRIRHPDARFVQDMYTYTEEGDSTRMYEEMHSGKPGYAIYVARTHDNPVAHNYEARQRERLIPELAKQYLEGVAINLRGMRAYSAFNVTRNTDDQLTLQDALPLHIAVDFNINPGMHIEVGQFNPTSDMFTVVYEIHGYRMDLRQAIQSFGRLIQDLGGWRWPGLEVYGDATGDAKWAGTGMSCYQILRQGLQDMDIPHRLRVPRANPLQVDRINAMNIAMMDLKGDVHWRCHPRCKLLINDLKKVKTDERGKLDKQNLALTHASDAESYRVSYLRPARVDGREHIGGQIGYSSGIAQVG